MPSAAMSFAKHAGGRRLDFDLRLVGLDGQDRFALANLFAGALMPLDDGALGHGVTEFGHLNTKAIELQV